MGPSKPGKQLTKGAKQILEENKTTIKFYNIMALGSFTIFSVIMSVFFLNALTTWTIVFNILAIAIYVASLQMLKYISKATYSENGQLIDSGVDLNMEGGLGEHIKDIIILTSTTQVLSLISIYFWLILLLIPARAFYLLWIHVLGPWFFQEAPENTEADEKKRKKAERKMRMRQ